MLICLQKRWLLSLHSDAPMNSLYSKAPMYFFEFKSAGRKKPAGTFELKRVLSALLKSKKRNGDFERKETYRHSQTNSSAFFHEKKFISASECRHIIGGLKQENKTPRRETRPALVQELHWLSDGKDEEHAEKYLLYFDAKMWHIEGKVDCHWCWKLIAFPTVDIRSERRDTRLTLAPKSDTQKGAGGEISARLWHQNEILRRETRPSLVLEFNCLSDGTYNERAEIHPLDFGTKIRHAEGSGWRDIRSTLAPKWDTSKGNSPVIGAGI